MSSPPLQIITGKGGTGKTSIAAALAWNHARRGQRVLCIELGARGDLAQIFDVTSSHPGQSRLVWGELYYAFYEGESALAEYVMRFLPLGRMFGRFFEHPVYRAFVEAGPGVRELMIIGKVRDELLGLSTKTPRWDTIVVDAGASGHVLQMLAMPSSVSRSFSFGLAQREATLVHRTLADPKTTAVHIVALPEEMPLKEAGEVVERLRDDLHLPVGRVIVNRCRPVPPSSESALLTLLEKCEVPAEWIAPVRRELGWAALQERGIASLEERTALRAERLPRLLRSSWGRKEIATLANLMGEGP